MTSLSAEAAGMKKKYSWGKIIVSLGKEGDSNTAHTYKTGKSGFICRMKLQTICILQLIKAPTW